MNPPADNPPLWRRLLIAALIVAGACVFRAVLFSGLGRGIPYLIFYPTVMLAALYGGLVAGLLATVLSALLAFFWIQRGYMSSLESMAMATFCLSCGLVSFICNALLVARRTARESQEILSLEVKARSHLASIVESSMDAIISKDLQGVVTSWNRGAEKIFGFPAEEIIGASITRLIPPDRLEEEARILELIRRGESLNHFETQRLAKDGRLIDLSVTASPIRDEAGQVMGVSKVARDISEKKLSERKIAQLNQDLERRVAERTAQLMAANHALQENATYARSLLEACLDPLVTINADGKITDVNEGTIKATGMARDQLIGTDFSDYFTEPHRAREGYRQVFAQDYVTDYPLTIRHRDGHLTEVLYNASVYRDTGGTVLGVFAAARDITKIKQAEIQARQLNTQLAEANQELEAFAYSVSHDLRAPLRSIDGFSRILLDDYRDRLDTEGQDSINRIRAATQRMAQLIDDLLQLSRVTRAELNRETVDLSELARTTVAELQRLEPQRLTEIIIAPGLVAQGDPHLLRIVVENLLGNAWKFTGRREVARIEFGGDPLDGTMRFFVRDNGAGFDPTYTAKLFGAFQRLHRSSDFPGTGIGLATVQRIIRRHGGRVWAEGRIDAGATFHFSLEAPSPTHPPTP